MGSKPASEMKTLIRTSLITEPLPDTQKHALCALQELSGPATSDEVARTLRARLGRSYCNLPSILSSLVARGLVRRQVDRGRELYSRTPVEW
jgi:DNA-binding MarR family transcriptional regulator